MQYILVVEKSHFFNYKLKLYHNMEILSNDMGTILLCIKNHFYYQKQVNWFYFSTIQSVITG